MRRRRPWAGACLALALCAAVAGLAAAATKAPAPRIVAVADVHGDLPAFKAILKDAGVVDASGAWTGGATTLVQLGDLLDRGPSMRGLLDYVMQLEKAASRQGGRVVAILGNHEVMNVTGDLRYVAPANYAEFADEKSEKRRADAWKKVQQHAARRAKRLGLPEPAFGEAEEKAWMDAHPPGFLEHRAAFGPDGLYGKWLRSRPAVFQAQGTAFLHGGLSPAVTEASLDEIDKRVHEEIAAHDLLQQRFVAEGLILPFFTLQESLEAVREELARRDAADAAARAAAEQAGKAFKPAAKDVERRKVYQVFDGWGGWLINSQEGPLWYRGFSERSDAEVAAEAARLTRAFGVKCFVVGHTPQPGGRIRARVDGAFVLADTGMLAGYVQGGRGSALEIAGGELTAIYPGGVRESLTAVALPKAAEVTAPPRFLGPDGNPLPFANDDEVLSFLRDADVEKVEEIGDGITHPRRLTMARNGVRARAVFRNVKSGEKLARIPGGKRELYFRDFYGFEPVAYRLSRLLGFDRIPPATLRSLEGEPGSVQLWIEKAMTEKRRRDSKAEPPSALHWKRQLQMMAVWDALVGNTDRNQGNYLYTPGWEIWLIDHTRAFRRGTDLPDAGEIVWCERGFWERLSAAGDTELRGAVADDLVAAEVEGLLARRRKLVERIGGLIRERGEGSVLFTYMR